MDGVGGEGVVDDVFDLQGLSFEHEDLRAGDVDVILVDD